VTDFLRIKQYQFHGNPFGGRGFVHGANGRANIMKLKQIFEIFRTRLKEKNIISLTGLEIAFRALFVKIQISNHEETLCRLT